MVVCWCLCILWCACVFAEQRLVKKYKNKIYIYYISSKLRIAWEIHVCAVSISKNPQKKRTFLVISLEDIFPFRGYIFWSWRLTHRGGGRIFAVFWPRTSKKQRYFGNLLYAEKLRFFGRARACAKQNSKKSDFFGKFPGCIFHHVSFSWLCFYTVLFGWSTTSGCRKNDVFSRETIRCFLAPESHGGDGYHSFRQ